MGVIPHRNDPGEPLRVLIGTRPQLGVTMRLTTKLLAAAAAVVLASATAAPQASATSTHASVPAVNVLAIPAPIVSVVRAATQDAKIEVKTTETHSGSWYTPPGWIAI